MWIRGRLIRPPVTDVLGTTFQFRFERLLEDLTATLASLMQILLMALVSSEVQTVGLLREPPSNHCGLSQKERCFA